MGLRGWGRGGAEGVGWGERLADGEGDGPAHPEPAGEQHEAARWVYGVGRG